MSVALVKFISLIMVMINFLLPETRCSNPQLTVSLWDQSSLAYQWEYEIEDDSVIEFVGVEGERLDDLEDGGSALLHFKFKARSEGKTNIIFTCYTHLSDKINEIVVLSVTVDSELNMSYKITNFGFMKTFAR